VQAGFGNARKHAPETPRVAVTGQVCTAVALNTTPLWRGSQGNHMNRIVWLVGAVVIVLFVLGFFGLR